MKVLGLRPIWLHRKATTFNGVGTSTTSGKLNIPTSVRLKKSDMVIPGYAHSLEIPKKPHPLLLSQPCRARLGMTKRAREGSIALARQVGTELFMIWIDHLIHDDFVILSSILVLSLMLTMLLEAQTNRVLLIVLHVQWSIIAGRIFPRIVLQADSIIVSCGLANFERTSWSTQILTNFGIAR